MTSQEEFAPYKSFRDAYLAFLGALNQPMQELLNKLLEVENASQDADSLLAQLSAAVHPNEVGLDGLLARNPYSNPRAYHDSIAGAAERGWLTVSKTGFTATSQSIQFYDKLVALLMEQAALLEEKVSVDLATLFALLEKLVAGMAAVKLPGGKPTFNFARNFEYKDKSPSLVWIRRHILTAHAYRDDCHIAAWQVHDLPGIAWESFSFIWEGEAHTAAALAEKLPYRSYTEADYANALAQLEQLGWVRLEDGQYQLSEKGKTVREQAELKTDQFYKTALDTLSASELQTLTGLIETLNTELAPPQPAES